jgi:hypothetical protein
MINSLECLILVEDLEHVVQDGDNDPSLEASIGHVVAFVRTHYRRSI